MTDTHKAFGGGTLSAWRGFGSITKIEDQPDGTIKVWGIASTGAQDSAGETVTPDAMKAALPDYEKFPALREMHGLSAAGKTLDAVVDDDGITRVEVLVVDPTAILKVKSGVYAGFSIGGKVLARDPADRSVITKLKLNEISLVDRPCNPEATIELWKADASTEEAPHMTTTPAPTNQEVLAKAQALAEAAGKPTRRNDYVVKARAELIAEAVAAAEEVAKAEAEAAALPDGGAVDGETQVVEKAEGDEAVADPAADLVAALEASVAKATAAAPEAGEPKEWITPGLGDFAKGLVVIAAQPDRDDPLAKGLYTVRRLADIVSQVADLQSSSAWEEDTEGDTKSAMPATLAAHVKSLGAALIAMTQEEVAELIAALPPEATLISPDPVLTVSDIAFAEKIVDLVKADTDLIAKAGARNSKGDAKKIQEIHDHSVDLGATCAQSHQAPASAKAETADDLAKAERLNDVLAKATEAIDKLTEDNADLRKRLGHLEAQTAPAKTVVSTPPGLTAVSKTADTTGAPDASAFTKADVEAYLASLPEGERGQVLLKIALGQPFNIGRPRA